MNKTGINWWSWHGLSWDRLRRRDRVNEHRTTLFAFLWLFSLAAIRIPQVHYDAPAWTGWALGFLSLLCSWLFVRAFMRMLREADELLRMVQLEALAAGCGAGLICGLTYVAVATPNPWATFAFFIPMSCAYLARVLLAVRGSARDAAGDGE